MNLQNASFNYSWFLTTIKSPFMLFKFWVIETSSPKTDNKHIIDLNSGLKRSETYFINYEKSQS